MKIRLLVLFLFVAVFFSGCIPGDGRSTLVNPSGFFSGIWHGWIAPVSLIIGFFNGNIRIYESFNTGWWYDFGYYIAIISGFGSLSFFRKRKKQKKID